LFAAAGDDAVIAEATRPLLGRLDDNVTLRCPEAEVDLVSARPQRRSHLIGGDVAAT